MMRKFDHKWAAALFAEAEGRMCWYLEGTHGRLSLRERDLVLTVFAITAKEVIVKLFGPDAVDYWDDPDDVSDE